MKTWKKYCTGLVTLAGLTPAAWAQIPGVPAAPAPDAAAAVAAPAAKPPGTIWAFLGLTKEQKEEFKRKCCQTKFGQLINNSLKPLSVFTGGVLGNFCPTTPTAADLAKPGAEGEAAKIMAEEADAPKRRAAVRYLGTVDCHYWGPEVEPALIAALRTDRNECVRWEAAMALGRGCCCTKKTIQALAITVSSSDKDGNPTEKSERVKAAASIALEHCLACYHETTAAPTPEETPAPRPLEPAAPKPIEPPPVPLPEKAAAGSTGIQQTTYTRQVDSMSLQQVVENAQKVLDAKGHAIIGTAPQRSGTSRSLLDLYMNAAGTTKLPGKTTVAPESAVPGPDMSRNSPKAAPTPVEVRTVQELPAEKPHAAVVSAPHAEKVILPTVVSAPRVEKVTLPTPPSTPVVTPTPAPVSPKPATVATTSPSPAVTKPLPVIQLVRAESPGSSQQYLSVLQTSIYPEQREWAALQLAGVDPRSDPQVVPGLMTAAREDSAAIVRAACVRALGQLNANTPAVVAALHGMKTDSDPRVRRAVDKTLAKLGTGTTSGGGSGVVPASYTMPGRTN